MNNDDFNNEENSNDSLFGRFENAFSDALHGTSSDIDLDDEYLDDEEEDDDSSDYEYDYGRDDSSSDDSSGESSESSDEEISESGEELTSDETAEIDGDETISDNDLNDVDDDYNPSEQNQSNDLPNRETPDNGGNNEPHQTGDNDVPNNERLNRVDNGNNPPEQNRFKNDGNTPNGKPSNNPSNPNQLHRNLPNSGNPAGNAVGNASEKAGEELAKKGVEEAGKKVVEEGVKKCAEAGVKAGADAMAAGTSTGAAAGGTVATGGWIWVVIIVIAVIIVLIFVFIIILFYGSSSKPGDYTDQMGYLNGNVCPYVTVTDNDNAGTYPFEEYIAGVVQAEVGFFGNGEVDKVFAVAARTYFYTHHNNCVIAGNASKQAFTPTKSQLIINAVNDTSGQVITKDGQMFSTEYDALAVAKDNGDSVVLKQKGQIIPKWWLTKHNIGASSLSYYASHNHGRGMSQWGALYLAEESGYDYKSILKYYYGDDVTIAVLSQTYGPTQSDGILAEALETYLPRNGSSVDSLNSKIYTNVRNAGVGTREGVVAAATTLVETMDSYGVKLPYSNGGGHGHYLDNYGYYNFNSSYGVNPAWGKPGSYPGFGSVTRVYTYFGLDCSGFVSWAIHNGGFAFRASSTGESYGPSCNSTTASCKSKPGDLLLIPGKHVMLIIGESGDTYTVAEAMGGDYGILITTHKKASKYEVVNMDKWYANNKRVDSYPY